MSEVRPGLPMEQAEPEIPGIRLYTSVCLAAGLALAIPLLARGLGTGAFLPALAALLLPLVRWRSGPAILILCCLWLVLADTYGMSPLALLEKVLTAFVSLFSREWPGWLAISPRARLKQAEPVLDILFCAAALIWISSYYRLLGVTRNIFPTDRRRRAKVILKSGRTRLGPVQEQKRAPSLAGSNEAPWLLISGVVCAVLAQLVVAWLKKRKAFSDLAFLPPLGVRIHIRDEIWHLLLLLWLFAVVLIVLTSLTSYLGALRMTPAESALYLQDQLWRQTRREQARLNRWLAWAEKRAAHRH